MYKVETKNGVLLESPSIRDIMDELSNMEYDTAVKFFYTKGESVKETNDIREFYSIIAEDRKEQEQESRK
jgi:hypothetical protein